MQRQGKDKRSPAEFLHFHRLIFHPSVDDISPAHYALIGQTLHTQPTQASGLEEERCPHTQLWFLEVELRAQLPQCPYPKLLLQCMCCCVQMSDASFVFRWRTTVADHVLNCSFGERVPFVVALHTEENHQKSTPDCSELNSMHQLYVSKSSEHTALLLFEKYTLTCFPRALRLGQLDQCIGRHAFQTSENRF